MKSIKSLVALLCAVAYMASVSVAFADVDKSKFTPGGCCDKAAKAGKTCEHKCCVAAGKDSKVCEKCNPKKDAPK